ncbi:hypothetical protein ACFV5N_14405 [Streptomyces sp. NPDC059853]|uniref:hypothetical protein n=1 Tax=Streptomyces sp. NPDC059853 TaxID=3346973 RepID=UPI0036519850
MSGAHTSRVQPQLSRLAERITQLVLNSGSLNITPPELHSRFGPLLRADGRSVYRRRESGLYTSPEVLNNEERVVAAARRTVAPACSRERFLGVAERWNGPRLDAGQERLAEVFACSDKLIVAGIGLAGSENTTCSL